MHWRLSALGGLLALAGCAAPVAPQEIGSSIHSCTIRVASGADLTAALARGRCGTEILLADGGYEGDFTLAATCPAGLPLAVRAEHPLAATILSPLRLSGDHASVQDLRFEGPHGVVSVGGTGNRVVRNSFTGWQGVAVRLTAGTGAEVAYNELSAPAPWDLGGDSRQGIASNEPNGGLHLNAWVHHNHFHDFPAKPRPMDYASGQSDAVEICGGGQPVSDRSSGWTIENNLVQRHRGGYGVIDILCGGTTVRHNTLVASPGGRIDLRRGSYSVLAGNWIEDAGGSVVHGGYHRVLGNHYARLDDGGYPELLLGLVLTAGTVPWDYVGPPRLADRTPVHQTAYHVLLAGNTTPLLEIGPQRSPAFHYPVVDTIVEGHDGPIIDGFAQGTIVDARITRPVASATRLEPSDVGPAAAPHERALPGCASASAPAP